MLEFVSGFLAGLGVTSIIVALIENKYHIINRIRKRIALLGNKGTEASLSLEYKSDKPFDKIVEEFKNKLRNQGNIRIVKSTNTSVKIEYGINSLNLMKNVKGNFFIELERMGCGIKELKDKLNSFLGLVSQLETKKVLGEFVGCDLSFTLPYKWDDMNLWVPSGLKVKKYNVSFSDENYKSDIDVSVNKVNIRSNAISSINHLVEKFV